MRALREGDIFLQDNIITSQYADAGRTGVNRQGTARKKFFFSLST